MVFGDNVRAHRAARALPRTPTQKRKEKERRGERREQRKQATRTNGREEQDHTPPLPITHTPHAQHCALAHHTTALPLPHNKHGNTKQGRSGDTTTPPAIQHGHPTNRKGTTIPNKGDTNIRREGHHHSTRPSFTMPPHLVMPPHHPQRPHPPPRRGGSRQRTPHHTKEYTHPHIPQHPAENSSMT